MRSALRSRVLPSLLLTTALSFTLLGAVTTPATAEPESADPMPTVDSVELVDTVPSGPDSVVIASTEFQGHLYLGVRLGFHDGWELWRTDGSPGGMQLVKRTLVPEGVELNEYNGLVAPSAFMSVGNTLFFLADDGPHGVELWRTDGSSEGTFQLPETAPGPTRYFDEGEGGRSGPRTFEVFDDRIFFTSVTGSGVSLFASDGTPEGTKRHGGPEVANNILLDQLAAVGDTLYFVQSVGGDGLTRLWRTDGTQEGTQVVRYFDPVSLPPYTPTTDLHVAGDQLFLLAYDGEDSRPLWVTDGTADGTLPLAGAGGEAFFNSPIAVGDTLLLSDSEDRLWRSDGTASGSSVYSEGATWFSSDAPRAFVAGGKVVFERSNRDSEPDQLWVSDGTDAGTVLLHDFGIGANPRVRQVQVLGDRLLFAADSEGEQLWVSDGTVDGTGVLATLDAGAQATAATVADGRAYLVVEGPGEGSEVWVSNGSAEGTGPISDLHGGNPLTERSVTNIREFNGAPHFVVDSEAGAPELWTANAGTVLPQFPVSNRFTIPLTGERDRATGTVTVQLRLPDAGTITAGPRRGSPVRTVSAGATARGMTSVTVRLTRAGKRELERKWDRSAKGIGRLPVKVEFTYRPDGAPARTKTRTLVFALT